MSWSVDLEITIPRRGPCRVRLSTDQLLGRHAQAVLDDARISRTAARLAVDAQGPHLEEISGLYDARGTPMERLHLIVGAEASLSDDGAVRLRVLRVEPDRATLAVQRLAEPPLLLHGPAWRITPGAANWLHPVDDLQRSPYGLITTTPGIWVLRRPGVPPQPLKAGDEAHVESDRLFFVCPPATPSAERATVRHGAALSPIFYRDRARSLIIVQHRGAEVVIGGSGFFALNALLDAPEFTDSATLAERAQRRWTTNNLNVAIHEVRSALGSIFVNLDSFLQKTKGARRFRLHDPRQLIEVPPKA